MVQETRGSVRRQTADVGMCGEFAVTKLSLGDKVRYALAAGLDHADHPSS